MKWWQRLTRWLASGVSDPAQWLIDWVRPMPNESGIDFTATTPLTYAPIFYSVNLISGHLGMLPLVVMRQDGDNKEPDISHPAYRLIKHEPNPDIGAHQFKGLLTSQALLYGNGRALIVRNSRGAPTELIPLAPERLKIEIVAGRKWHLYRNDDQDEIPIPDRDVLHIAGLGYDGVQGYSVIELARQSWGLGLAAERASARHFKHNAVPNLIIETPRGAFKDEAKARQFLEKWQEYHGSGRSVGLLRDGMAAKPLAMPARDAEWIGQRKFQRQDVALWFGLDFIPGDDTAISYNSLEQHSQAYIRNTLGRWVSVWEQECRKKLLTEVQKRRDTHFFKFTTAALLRGTTKERFEVYSLARQNEILSVDEIRALEDLNPVPGGDDRSNPNINPRTAGGGSESEEPVTVPMTPDEDGAAAALTHLVAAERTAIIKAVQRGGNFVRWIDTFYKNHQRVAAAVFTGLGQPATAERYCSEGLAEMLDLAGGCRHHELAATVAAYDWEGRAHRWANTLEKVPV